MHPAGSDASSTDGYGSKSCTLTILHQTFHLTQIPSIHIPQCLKQLVRIAIFPEREFDYERVGDYYKPFFSITSTQDDSGLSVVLDDTTLRKFPFPDQLISGPTLRAIQVYQGSEAINETGYIQALAAPLAELNISPIYLSTYSSDIILVLEDELEIAHSRLQEIIDFNGHDWAQIIQAQKMRKETNTDRSTIAISLLQRNLSMFSLSTRDINLCAKDLLSLFYYPERKEVQFLSYTLLGDEITVITNSSLFDTFQNDALQINANNWSCIQISAGSSLSQEGSLVSSVAGVLSRNAVSIYYLSTFANDYTLVHTSQFDNAANLLENALGALVFS